MNGLFLCKSVFATHNSLVSLPGFETKSYIDALEKYRITNLMAVQTMLARVVKETDALAGRDFSALKRIWLGSAPLTLGLNRTHKGSLPGDSRRKRLRYDRSRACGLRPTP